jgi:hypothetical protein
MGMLLIILLAFVAVGVIAYLLKQYFHDKPQELQTWVHVASIAASLAGAVSLIWAAATFYESSRLQRELTAANIYREHLELSLSNPTLANLELTGGMLTDREHLEKYEWYVGHALFSFETILEAKPKDQEWRDVGIELVRDHESYIKSGRLRCTHYTKQVRRLLNDALDPDPCPNKKGSDSSSKSN